MLRERTICGLGWGERKSLGGKHINLSGRMDLFQGEMECRKVRGGIGKTPHGAVVEFRDLGGQCLLPEAGGFSVSLQSDGLIPCMLCPCLATLFSKCLGCVCLSPPLDQEFFEDTVRSYCLSNQCLAG